MYYFLSTILTVLSIILLFKDFKRDANWRLKLRIKKWVINFLYLGNLVCLYLAGGLVPVILSIMFTGILYLYIVWAAVVIYWPFKALVSRWPFNKILKGN